MDVRGINQNNYMIRFLENNIVMYFAVFVLYTLFVLCLYYTVGTRNMLWLYTIIIAYLLDIFYFLSSIIILIRSLIGKSTKSNVIFIVSIYFLKAVVWFRNPILDLVKHYF